MRTVVLGIGNILLQDEGVGVRVVEALNKRFDLPGDIEVVDGGTTGMELLPMLEGLETLIVVDAVRNGQKPGCVFRLEGTDVPSFFKTKLSPHQVGLCDILATLTFKGSAPDKVVLIGVQPSSMALGLELTPTVQAGVDKAVDLVVEELAALGCEARPLN